MSGHPAPKGKRRINQRFLNRARLTPDRIRKFVGSEGQAFLFDADLTRLAGRPTGGELVDFDRSRKGRMNSSSQ